MNVGKVKKKNWAWKPVKSLLIPFEDSDPIGTTRCRLEAPKFSDAEIEEASNMLGFVKASSSKQVLNFRIEGESDRGKNQSNFNTLKSQLEKSRIYSADRAIICSRKGERQISTIRCGAK